MLLKELRIRAGMTQTEMSEKLEIPKRTIENWESGSRKCPGYVEKLIAEKMEEIIMENTKNYAGLVWGNLSVEEQEMLLDGANAVDGLGGDNARKGGECIIDLSVYPFSVLGRLEIGEWEDAIQISDEAIIYNSEG